MTMVRRALHVFAFALVLASLIVVGLTVVAVAVSGALAGTFVTMLYGFGLGVAAHGYAARFLARPVPDARPEPATSRCLHAWAGEAEGGAWDLHICLRPWEHTGPCTCECGELDRR